jgi:membrane-bound ClpP family serine protease
MDAKELMAFLAPPNMTARETLLGLTGGAIALLLVAVGTSLYRRDYRHGILYFLVASLLGFVFFRKRKVALVVGGLSCILGLVSLSFPFHPSFAGLVLLLGSAAALSLMIRWRYKKYPYLSFKHVHTVFEGEEAMAAENARIEAEAREVTKKRPYGPWLFR